MRVRSRAVGDLDVQRIHSGLLHEQMSDQVA